MKAIIFDCFGVLTNDRWQEFLSTLPEEADVEGARGLRRAFEQGLISQDEFIIGIKEATGKDPKPLYDYSTGSEVVKNDVLLQYIKELRGKGLKIGLLSNIATNWIREEFLSQEEQQLFDEMILSFEVGMGKPDERIFMLACERLRVSPQEAVMIDDVAYYCDAANEIGLKSIVYADFKQMKNELELLLKIRQ